MKTTQNTTGFPAWEDPFIDGDARLLMRPLTLEDSQLIVTWRNNPRVRNRYVYRELFTLEGQKNYFREKVKTGQVEQFIFCEREGKRPIGCSVFNDIHPDEYAEYGNWIGEDDAVGKGYNFPMMKMSFEYAFHTMQLQYIVSRVFDDNPASLQTCWKMGYHIERKDDHVICSDGEQKSLIFIKISKEDFMKSCAAT